MINKLDLIIIFFILNFLSISYCFKSELVHLVKSEYLLVNEDGIFHFKNNFDNEIEKIDSINEEQNTSDTKKNIKKIFIKLNASKIILMYLSIISYTFIILKEILLKKLEYLKKISKINMLCFLLILH